MLDEVPGLSVEQSDFSIMKNLVTCVFCCSLSAVFLSLVKPENMKRKNIFTKR